MLKSFVEFKEKQAACQCDLCAKMYTVTQETYTQVLCLKTILQLDETLTARYQLICLDCSIRLSKKIITDKVDVVSVHTSQPQFASYYKMLHDTKPLIRGIDYDENAQGHWIFSRWHLLKCVTCCGNACRNCPYGHSNVIKKK